MFLSDIKLDEEELRILSSDEYYIKKKELVPMCIIVKSYFDCRKKKRKTEAALAFELDWMTNCYELYKEINDDNYKIGTSIVFMVTRPSPREVFAAAFRDRVIQHLVLYYINPLMEEKAFINDNYNCRKGKGIQLGVERLQEQLKEYTNNYTKDAYIAKFDLKGFFMSIDKRLLWKHFRKFFNHWYVGPNKSLIRKLCHMIIMHCPEKNCARQTPKRMWKHLPDHKSLFKTDKYHGLAIGNITSQMFANFYLSLFDHWITNIFKCYGRYVDDFFVIYEDKDFILSQVKPIDEFLRNVLKVALNPKKVHIQHWNKGCKFTGAVVKGKLKYLSNRSVSNAINKIRKANKQAESNPNYPKEHVNELVQSINSYLGMAIHYNSFKVRKRIVSEINELWRKCCYPDEKYSKLIPMKRYDIRNQCVRKARMKILFSLEEDPCPYTEYYEDKAKHFFYWRLKRKGLSDKVINEIRRTKRFLRTQKPYYNNLRPKANNIADDILKEFKIIKRRRFIWKPFLKEKKRGNLTTCSLQH